MDPQLEELYGPLHRIKFSDQKVPISSSHQNFTNILKLQDPYMNPGFTNHQLNPSNPSYSLSMPLPGPNEDSDFTDVLNYINQVLMEEDENNLFRSYHEPSALAAAEKSLYEVLEQKCQPPQTLYYVPQADCEKLNESFDSSYITYGGNIPTNHYSFGYVDEYNHQLVPDPSVSSLNSSVKQLNFLQPNSESPFSLDSPVSALSVSDIFSDSQSMLQFQRGLEEARKFLPKGSLYVGPTNIESSSENGVLTRGKKHRQPEEVWSQEERGSNKQSALAPISDEAVLRSEMFDRVLLCSGGKNDAALREAVQSELNKDVQIAQAKGASSGKGRGKKKGNKKDVVDLRTLLSLCAQAVGSNDNRSANDLLMQIRQHSSPEGDGNQRLAHYFADGLEARLAGVGTPIYKCILTGPSSAVDILRAYHTILAICPFKKIANFISNRTILDVAEKATRVHIIDLGMVYGFQWPCLMQRLSTRPGGPPKLRITGVDLPQPGFKPAKRLEESGCRLKNYADSFNIPFEFNAVAKKWESLTIEDLKIDKDELLIINCLFRFKYIPEETAMVECPRDRVLQLIKQMKPAVFIQGVVNGAFNSPFFVTRFREAVFHFSTLFDMLEATLPRNSKERYLIEKEIFGKQAMNVIACEGLERIERPETYKQWQVRNERAGFKQLPLDREILEMAKKRTTSIYHKDFSMDEDGQWLLQGWKGRIVYGMTTWKYVD